MARIRKWLPKLALEAASVMAISATGITAGLSATNVRPEDFSTRNR